jgi:hypothetical protein
MAQRTAQQRDNKQIRLVVLLIPVALGLLTWFSGVQKLRSSGPPEDGVPAGMNFFMGSVMLLAAARDVRKLFLGGVVGSKRVARHLWRMCFGLFIATGSFFLGPSNRPLRFLSTMGLRQPVFRDCVTPGSASVPGCPATLFADFLDGSSSLHKCIQASIQLSSASPDLTRLRRMKQRQWQLIQ